MNNLKFHTNLKNKNNNDPFWVGTKHKYGLPKAVAVAYEAKSEKAKLDWQHCKNTWKKAAPKQGYVPQIL